MPFQPINYAGIAPLGLSGIEQGMKLAQMPMEQGRQNRELQLREALAKMQLQRAPFELEQLKAKTSLDKMSADRMRAFQDLLRSGEQRDMAVIDEGKAESMPHPRPIEGFQGMFQNASDAQPGRLGYAERPIAGEKQERVVVNEGNPSLYRLDKIYNDRPEFRDFVEKLGYKTTRSIKQSPETGQIFSEITYPSGRTEVQAVNVGKQPEQIERAKSYAKSEGKVYDNALDSIQTSQGAIDNLDYINSLIKGNPEFRNVTGPVQSILAKWTGRPEDRELLGNIESSVGNIVLDAAKSIKGAFTGRDLGLINSIKPSVKDFPDQFRGKLQAMRLAAEQVTRRNQLIADMMRGGASPNEAIAEARKATDFDALRKEIDNLTGRASDLPTFSSKQEFQNYLKTLNQADREAMKLKMFGGQQ